ncbi:hypothetical protein J1N35_012568 [Gossypium stocksii]|uniref:Defensin-like protein n=1 Tax=Gossypium stocksii TaxID=47602 RepID=A0A9D3W6D2_9ROSI|nr:hypothetical protein J1N35_012568 [Gossypium stocksii]
MIKFFPLFYIFAILLKLNTSAIESLFARKWIVHNVKRKCEASKSGKGKCEKLLPNDIGTCKCLNECDDNGNGNENSSPKNKKCNGGIGPCSGQYDENCCERNCAIKYPGPLGGYGFCMNIVGAPAPYGCICYFNC